MTEHGLDILGMYISFYKLFLYMGMAVAFGITVATAKRHSLPTIRVLLCLLLMGIFGIVGARFLNICLNFALYTDQPWRILTLQPIGYSLYGGLIFACITAIIYAKSAKIDIYKLADCAVYAIGIGIVFMKTGCFLNGCCFGSPCNLPWAVKFPLDTPAGIYYLSQGQGLFSMSAPAIHPTQIYEACAAIISMVAAFLISKKWRKDGVCALGFIIAFTSFRLMILYLRVFSDGAVLHTIVYTSMYALIISVAVVLLIKKVKQKNIE